MTAKKKSAPANGELGAPPSDLELMLYADGELDEARCREIEAHLARDARSRAKLVGLDVVAAALREGARSSTLGAGIADAVMARIESGDVEQVKGPANAESRPTLKIENGAAARPLSTAELSGQVSAGGKPAARLGAKPANDNARGIFALAALAVAAAAAMMIWGRMETEPPRSALTEPKPPETMAAPPVATPEPAPAPSPESEIERGVEVAAVDFGARMGSIFYVPQGAAASSPTTTVVWLSDDAPGE